MLGAGGHAKVMLALVEAAGLSVRGVCDPALAAAGTAAWRGIPVLGDDKALADFDPGEFGLINGVGQLARPGARHQLFERLRGMGFTFPALIHPTAWVAPTTQLEQGVQIMAGVVVQPDCLIGENTIINTRASIDHDCRIGRQAHIAPSATLCGGAKVGDHAFIGSGATLIQEVNVGAYAVVGAGVTLVRDLPALARVLGAPARFSISSSNEQAD